MTVDVVEVQVPGPVDVVAVPVPNTTTAVQVQVPGIPGPVGPPGPGNTLFVSPTPPVTARVDDVWIQSAQ